MDWFNRLSFMLKEIHHAQIKAPVSEPSLGEAYDPLFRRSKKQVGREANMAAIPERKILAEGPRLRVGGGRDDV